MCAKAEKQNKKTPQRTGCWFSESSFTSASLYLIQRKRTLHQAEPHIFYSKVSLQEVCVRESGWPDGRIPLTLAAPEVAKTISLHFQTDACLSDGQTQRGA